MNDNKELNTLLENLFKSVKDAYGIASMIKDIKEKEVGNNKELKWTDTDMKLFAKQFLSILNDREHASLEAELDEFSKDKEVSDKPKDYEVIHVITHLDNNGSYIYTEIESVKRLSDNELFAIKNVTDEGIIKGFYIADNILWVRFEEKGGVVSINDIQKVPKLDYEILERFDYYEGAYDGDIAPIKKVRRLKDNEVFSIGDILHDGCIETVITSISGGNYPILKGDKGSIGLDVARKKRVPLFTTEDGKEIFEGDRCWYMTEDFRIDFYDFIVHSEKNREHDLKHYSDYKYFSTEDKAKEYVLMNKPCLSIKEIMNNAKYVTNFRIEIDYKGLKELAKQKINNQ